MDEDRDDGGVRGTEIQAKGNTRNWKERIGPNRRKQRLLAPKRRESACRDFQSAKKEEKDELEPGSEGAIAQRGTNGRTGNLGSSAFGGGGKLGVISWTTIKKVKSIMRHVEFALNGREKKKGTSGDLRVKMTQKRGGEGYCGQASDRGNGSQRPDKGGVVSGGGGSLQPGFFQGVGLT